MRLEFQKIRAEYQQITEQLSSGNTFDLAKLGKRQTELMSLVEKIELLDKHQRELADNQELAHTAEPSLKQLIVEENTELHQAIERLTEELETEMLPKDPNDNRNILLEMRAGAGGDEATLFAAELFRCYGKFAETHKFKIKIISSSKSEVSGFKEVIAEITGNGSPGPYGWFKYESGVHRVQRVPETEKSGRVHTSTITVAVLPEIEEHDFQIDPKDLKIEATTSSGNGGQSVNTTYSAIRIVHIPTGITAQCQDERSQAQNKEKALAVIRARVAAHYQEIEEKKVKDARRSQIGSGDRSEKIRTYNFPQDRITDHRINENFNQINLIMEGKLQDIITALKTAEIDMQKQQLSQS